MEHNLDESMHIRYIDVASSNIQQYISIYRYIDISGM